MRAPSPEKINLWAMIVSCGIEQEFERDWTGRIKYKRTNCYIRADATPEFVQALVSANTLLSDARKGSAGMLASAQEQVRQRLLAATRSLNARPAKD